MILEKGKDFFEQFKQYILEEHKDDVYSFAKYYETLKQYRDVVGIKEFIEDIERCYVEISFLEDWTEGYTGGNFTFQLYALSPKTSRGWESRLKHAYKLEMLYDDRSWGYCTCTETTLGYREDKGCNGEDCDWIAPQISIEKTEDIAYFAFDGEERDLWKALDEWEDDLKEHNKKLLENKIGYIDSQLLSLNTEREMLEEKKLKLLMENDKED